MTKAYFIKMTQSL